jgi:hypothetical protein
MHDMIDLIKDNAGKPMADWFLPLIEALALAEMPNLQFLKAASQEAPSDLAESLTVLAEFGAEDALIRLLRQCSQNQPAGSIPVILVILRRRDDEYQLADRLMSALSGERGNHWFGIRKDIVEVVLALRRATLEKDADRLMKGIGKYGNPSLALEAAASFQYHFSGGREAVLSAVGEGDNWHLAQVLKTLRAATVKDIDPKASLDTIISGIPFGKHEEVASYLAGQALKEEADRCLELKDEPPF